MLAKIIATEKEEVTSMIIRGTNSQNIVYNEAFEITRDFHKNLEEFFNVMEKGNNDRIYYERRSRQYFRDTKISTNRIIGLKALTQSFVSIFMHSPHLGTSHEAILLKKFKNIIYVDGQSLYPYYVAALMCLNFEKLKRERVFDRNIENYKHHIMSIACELIAGICPSINDNKKIDLYCSKLLNVVRNVNTYAEYIEKSFDIFHDVTKKWVEKRGAKYKHSIKDNSGFTNFLLTHLRGGDIDKIEYDLSQPLILRGRIVKSRIDRNGYNYGFIEASPNDVFFHEENNESLDFTNIYGKTVLYEIIQDSFKGDNRALIHEVISND